MPAGDAHAEEIEALSEAAERHEESGSAPEAASDQDNERQAEPAQPEPEPQPEDNRPKRTGWWSRRSFF